MAWKNPDTTPEGKRERAVAILRLEDGVPIANKIAWLMEKKGLTSEEIKVALHEAAFGTKEEFEEALGCQVEVILV